MSLFASIGTGRGLDPRQAGIDAARQALANLQRLPGGMGFVFVSGDYDFDQVMSAAGSILTGIPILGISVLGASPGGESGTRSVSAALLAGDGLLARTRFWPQIEAVPAGFVEPIAGKQTGRLSYQALMIACDGFTGDTQAILANMPSRIPIFGGLAAGNLGHGLSYQHGGGRSGSGGMAVGLLDGPFQISTAATHAWKPVGAYAQITRCEGPLIHEIDGQRASQFYANWFGHSEKDWTKPPLKHLVRLYPLGLEAGTGGNGGEFTLHSPLRFEADGRLRLQTSVPQERFAHLMVASSEGCLDAARNAAQKALAGLRNPDPVLAIVLADIGWKMQLEPESGAEFETIQAVIGAEVPLIGGYTLGQFTRLSTGTGLLLNQHIQVILISEA